MEELFSPEFWGYVRAKQHQGQRYGQAVFNVAAYFYDETRQLGATAVDPFYNDKRVPSFLEELADLLTL